ncbi:hypothetical protein C7Y66_04220 [Chroococcidiopsis sp. CCALA 051]|uniref:hypothetical protein n=1 Tax=Chroococcidiopsis sp. CCALA 051 TaxID=869949 RepID=UPI000D0DF8D2|nr:hypothetical protein [Chroococcidiopsis sp. CCALA 051]PSM50363.1 hypothetical protein C7Y66_04220 [Chroococcidiopsis sp. CCALA 051]
MKIPTIASAITSAIALSLLTFSSTPAQARTFSTSCVTPQTVNGNTITFTPALTRARNLARQAAEKVNGGLSQYRAAASMYGLSFETPCVDSGNSWTFTFTGSQPGSTIPSVESIVTVAKDGSKVTVDYNGSIRS